MQGNGKEDEREILRTIYDGGSNMIFDREKISGFEWIWNNNNNNENEPWNEMCDVKLNVKVLAEGR